ncbi:hypothetical protein PF011_g22950 [Phytophthora fragariae]|uniref:Uncharacterized protein n=1 Tax=Phytophthora fragariae TaxID=53985 RepID=A0A6A3IAY8_9STRA|nr:hypothetical protein PF011_g22950 [Phytophthora fragariae]
MYTDDTVADSSTDEDERSNQQELTARGRSESQGQLGDQDTDLDRSSYFVLSEPNYTYEAVPAFTPDVNRTASNNKKIYGKPMSTLERFQWHQGFLDFHTLQPVRKPSRDRVYEPRFRSTSHVDAFLAALPLYEMYAQFQNDEDSSHIYAWLQASLKASEITLTMIKLRQRLCEWDIERLDDFLDSHVEHHIAMEADKSYDENAIREHTKEVFFKELEYKARVREAAALEWLAVWTYQTEVMFPRLVVSLRH